MQGNEFAAQRLQAGQMSEMGPPNLCLIGRVGGGVAVKALELQARVHEAIDVLSVSRISFSLGSPSSASCKVGGLAALKGMSSAMRFTCP